MLLEQNKYYLTKTGAVVGPMCWDEGTGHFDALGKSWTPGGSSTTDRQDDVVSLAIRDEVYEMIEGVARRIYDALGKADDSAWIGDFDFGTTTLDGHFDMRIVAIHFLRNSIPCDEPRR